MSIAQEMLVDPVLLILDEATSGLDSTKGKVVTSAHQPSSSVYQMFDNEPVLSEGHWLYFGKGNVFLRYFDQIGSAPSFPMNSAEFLLDLCAISPDESGGFSAGH